jgi:hypothetical protein
MSRILRRPMFRGGPVDSRGTGITSGLMDEPKRGLVDGPGGYAGKLILGRDLNPLLNLNNMDSYIPVGQVEETETETDDRGFLQKFYDTLNPSKETVEERLKKQDEGMTTFDEKMENIGVVTNKRKQEIADEAIAKATATVGGKSEAPGGGDPGMFLTPKEKDLSTSNEPSSTVIDEKALIREQAELFKELLGEQNEKKLKDARISDASDYLLKFFEGSQKEGATVGSAAADVAGFATAKPSKTETAKASIEKGDQTATALAINDYIAGKRSKEATDQLITKLGLSAELKKGNVKEQIRDATVKLGGSPPLSVLQSILAADGPVEVITKEQVEAGYEPNQDGSDDGKYYLEEDTKTIYKVVGNKKVRL